MARGHLTAMGLGARIGDMVCRCGSNVILVVVPGDAGEQHGVRRLRPVAAVAYCQRCAVEAGWPWLTSEPPKGKRGGLRKR